MSNHAEPNWQPISQLPLLTSMVDDVLENTEEQYQSFAAVKDRPHVLDDDIVNRAIRLYQAQIDDVWFYEQQFARWQAEPLTDSQRAEVDRLSAQLPRIKELSQAILNLMDEMKDGTINKIMEKSDLELGLEFFLKHLKD
jgi:molecular chaperone GrpE (heat shock protein)